MGVVERNIPMDPFISGFVRTSGILHRMLLLLATLGVADVLLVNWQPVRMLRYHTHIG